MRLLTGDNDCLDCVACMVFVCLCVFFLCCVGGFCLVWVLLCYSYFVSLRGLWAAGL